MILTCYSVDLLKDAGTYWNMYRTNKILNIKCERPNKILMLRKPWVFIYCILVTIYYQVALELKLTNTE